MEIVKKILIKIFPAIYLKKICNDMISSILVGNINNNMVSLLVFKVGKVIKIKNKFFIHLDCNDTSGKKYDLLMPACEALKIHENNDLIKQFDTNEVFIKELER